MLRSEAWLLSNQSVELLGGAALSSPRSGSWSSAGVSRFGLQKNLVRTSVIPLSELGDDAGQVRHGQRPSFKDAGLLPETSADSRAQR